MLWDDVFEPALANTAQEARGQFLPAAYAPVAAAGYYAMGWRIVNSVPYNSSVAVGKAFITQLLNNLPLSYSFTLQACRLLRRRSHAVPEAHTSSAAPRG